MPENPNAETPHRTEPAIEDPGEDWLRDTPNIPQDEPSQRNPAQEGMDAARQDTAIAEFLSNPKTQAAVAELLQAKKLTLADATVTQGIWGWPGAAECATVELSNGEEYMVTPDEDTTHALAIEFVKNDLNDSPENFNTSFIERYIDLDQVRQALMSDVEEIAREDAFESGKTNEAGEFDEDAITREAEETLKDPIAYLKETFGEEDGLKQAIQFGGINIDEAAEDAVAADGDGHFLSSYDGDVHDLPISGGQFWRTN